MVITENQGNIELTQSILQLRRVSYGVFAIAGYAGVSAHGKSI